MKIPLKKLGITRKAPAVPVVKASVEVTPTSDGGHDVTTSHADGSASVDHHNADHERIGGEYRGPDHGHDGPDHDHGGADHDHPDHADHPDH
jgi:hypothetical protein